MCDDNQLEKALVKPFWLKISSAVQHQSWEQSQCHSNGMARYNAYLNSVCLHTFFDWLKGSQPELPLPSIYPSNLPSIWEVVNGAAIGIGEKRIVLIPSENMDLELCVPQEWVDIPSWAGDYYLAVQVNLEADEGDCWIEVCGFTTHRQLKNFGRYNASDRTYVFPTENLTRHLSVMWVTLFVKMQEEIPQLPTLSEAQAQKLIEQLGDASINSPRLRVEVPFEQWAALLDNDEWRVQLYHRRIGRMVVASTTMNNLSKWFQNIFETPWVSLNSVLNTENLAFNFRQRELDVVGLSVTGIKLIDLGMELGNESVALLVGLTPEAEEKVGIRVQLHPKNTNYLPPNIRLALLSSDGATLQEFAARSQDNFIQLKRFTCPKGKLFKILVAIDDFSITEDFVIQPLAAENYE